MIAVAEDMRSRRLRAGLVDDAPLHALASQQAQDAETVATSEGRGCAGEWWRPFGPTGSQSDDISDVTLSTKRNAEVVTMRSNAKRKGYQSGGYVGGDPYGPDPDLMTWQAH